MAGSLAARSALRNVTYCRTHLVNADFEQAIPAEACIGAHVTGI